MIQCQRCNKQYIYYVGETEQTFHEWINSHRSDVKLRLEKPMAAHFNLATHTLVNTNRSLRKA